MKLRAMAMVVALCFATTAHALAVIDFLQLGLSDQMSALKPISIAFLRAGYKNVPENEYKLASEIKKLAYEKGYTFQNVEDVSREAAIRLGMTR